MHREIAYQLMSVIKKMLVNLNTASKVVKKEQTNILVIAYIVFIPKNIRVPPGYRKLKFFL